MPSPLVGLVGSSLAGGLAQAGAARSAQRAQERASADQLALQREMWGTTREDLSPYRQSGGNALQAYQYELGLGDAPMIGGQQYQGIGMSPAAQFALGQGTDAIQASAAARGGLRSGNALQSLEGFRFGLAAQDRDSQLNRLAGLTDMGMGAASLNASNNNAMASMGSNALANRGNAQAAGAVGVGNAFGNMFGQLGGIYGYMRQ